MNHPALAEYTQRRAKTTWPGEHRGIRYNVVFWDYRDGTDPLDRDPPHGTWNFYLLLPEPQWKTADWNALIAPEDTGHRLAMKGRRIWKERQSVLVDLDWPGGMTFYRVEGIPPYTGIKAGCDYNHLWDAEAGYPATLASVEADARRLIDELLERFTPLVRCAWTGEYADASEMLATKWPDKFVLPSAKDRVPAEWFEGMPA